MYKTNKNNSGFAHHALLGVVVVAIIALAGVKVLTATHALTDNSSGQSQAASTAGILPSCGSIELIKLYGLQVYPDDTIIHSSISANFLVKKKDYITKFTPVFKIWNNKTDWSHSDKYTHPVFQGHLNNQVFFFFQVPIWVATADGSFKWTLDVYGKKYGIVKCHSKIKGYAGTACDAKTGRWRLEGYSQ